MYKNLQASLGHLTNQELFDTSLYSKTTFYAWLKGPEDRKQREVTFIAEAVAVNAIQVILTYPHFGGEKGQAYMIYHRLGYIPRHVYQDLKQAVSLIVFQQAYALNLLPHPSVYQHERPNGINEIWAEDFTTVGVLGFTYPVALVEDVYSTKYLGVSVQLKENSQLVAEPVEMAVTENNNKGPENFILSDHGSQYVSDAHGQLLARHEIVQKLIPACKPQYNGSIECGIRDFKSVFYNVLSQNDFKEFAANDMNPTDKKKKLLETVIITVDKSKHILNAVIPRPALGGVTPQDVHLGIAEEKKKLNADYLKNEQMKEKVAGWSKSVYDLVKDVLKQNNFSNKELLIKHCFFRPRPLRRISKLPIEVWTN